MGSNAPPGDDVSTIARPRLSVTAPPRASFDLVVEEGPDRGLRFSVDGAAPSRILIGTSPACDARLTDRAVSRRHAALEVCAKGLRVVDLDSKNGTAVGNLDVRDVVLGGGEAICVGGTVIRVVRAAARPAPLTKETRFGRVLGMSREMRRLYQLCHRLADVDVPVVIEGETGTGKEVLAESLHEMGPRRDGPFVVFDCTAVPPNLVESELFGHERGAFTGALAPRTGVFEQAHGGTLLIDEIGDLDPALQPKLLRALERSEVRRIGSNEWIKVDVRVLSATRRDLDREVQEGRFRDDLFHRLAVARIELPPLRERRGDVVLLARTFAREIAGREGALPDALLSRWEDLPWPGNIRQLRNAVAKQLALGELVDPEGHAQIGPDGSVLGTVALARPGAPPAESDFMSEVIALDLALVAARQRVVAEFERRYIAAVLERHGGNVARAAAASGIARRYFQLLRARLTRPR